MTGGGRQRRFHGHGRHRSPGRHRRPLRGARRLAPCGWRPQRGQVVSDRLRPALKGIERADSVVIDAHKMMLVPALATLVLFREGRRSFETFSQQATYLFDGADPTETWFDLAQRTLECTKRIPGPAGLRLPARPTAPTSSPPTWSGCSIWARPSAAGRRRRPTGNWPRNPKATSSASATPRRAIADADAFQAKVREAIVQEGSFYIVKTVLRGKTYLRVTLINPRTECRSRSPAPSNGWRPGPE